MRASALSHAGLARAENEDAYLVDPEKGLFAVADGMGGHRAGGVASRLALVELKAAQELDGPEALGKSVLEANVAIFHRAMGNCEEAGMGTTLTAARISGAFVYLAHVGDSRAYLFRGGELRLLTEDHSLVGELLRKGGLSQEEARHHPQRNVLTRALGTSPEVEVDMIQVALREGDRLLLCTDGLSGYVQDHEMGLYLNLPGLEEAARRLVDLALEKGGPDNVTVVLVEYC